MSGQSLIIRLYFRNSTPQKNVLSLIINVSHDVDFALLYARQVSVQCVCLCICPMWIRIYTSQVQPYVKGAHWLFWLWVDLGEVIICGRQHSWETLFIGTKQHIAQTRIYILVLPENKPEIRFWLNRTQKPINPLARTNQLGMIQIGSSKLRDKMIRK